MWGNNGIIERNDLVTNSILNLRVLANWWTVAKVSGKNTNAIRKLEITLIKAKNVVKHSC